MEELELYRRLAAVLADSLDLDQLGARVARLVVDAVAASVCFVHLVDHEAGYLELVGATPPFDVNVHHIRLGIGDGVAGWVAQTGEPAVVPDKWHDHRYRYFPELHGEQFASLVSVPLSQGDGPTVGVINVHWVFQDPDLEEHARILVSVASLLAGAFANALSLARIARHEHRLELLAERLLAAQDEERRRMQLELHDGVLQLLYALRYRLAAIEARSRLTGADRADLEQALALVATTTTSVAAMVRDPGGLLVDDLGIVGGLMALEHAYPGFSVELEDFDEEAIAALEPGRARSLLRLLQEATANAWRHSGADGCTLRIRRSGTMLLVSIRDRGQGFDPEAARSGTGLGLASLEERARGLGGTLTIASRPGMGTLVRLSLPLAGDAVP
jgi:signal transduction histidine kinase